MSKLKTVGFKSSSIIVKSVYGLFSFFALIFTDGISRRETLSEASQHLFQISMLFIHSFLSLEV